MSIFYSAIRAGFFDDTIHDSLPDDAVPVTSEQHRLILADQAQGMLIVAGADGSPIAVSRPGLTVEEELSQLRDERNRLLTASDYTQMPDAPLTDSQRDAWRIYRQALRDLPETMSDPATCEWPIIPA